MGDDTDNAGDDDDGIQALASLIALATSPTTSSFLVNASADGKLDAWIDFNRDGDWLDVGEQIFASQLVSAGANVLSYTLPAGASVGETYARFRLSSVGGLLPTGPADDGEVEDYRHELVRGDAGAEVVITILDGETDILAEGPQILARRRGAELFRTPGSTVASWDFRGTSGDNTLGLSTLAPIPLDFDGGDGTDRLKLLDRSHTIDLTNTVLTRLSNIEVVDIVGTGPNRLTLSDRAVRDITDSDHVLLLHHDDDDQIDYGAGWRSAGPRLVNDLYVHVLRNGDVELHIANQLAWRNPYLQLDVNQDGTTSPLDALIIINSLNELGTRPLTTPASNNEIPKFYYDVSGDRFMSPFDAVLVINFLNGAEGESGGEVRRLQSPFRLKTPIRLSCDRPTRCSPSLRPAYYVAAIT